MYEGLLTHARCYAAEQGRRSPRLWSSQPRDLPKGLVVILEHISASFKPETLAKIPSHHILDLISICGFDNRDQAETALRSYCYDLYRCVLVTWPEDAPFADWLSEAVDASFRKCQLDNEIEERLSAQLRPPSPLELSECREKALPRLPGGRALETQGPSPTASDPPRGTARPLHIDSDTITGKLPRRTRLTNWRFQEGSSNKTLLIDIQVGGRRWVTEEFAHRKFKLRLLRFWIHRGGRETAIKQAGGTITDKTQHLIHDILDENRDDSTYLVEWVGYGNESCSWEPKSGISEELLQDFRQKRLRQSCG